MPITSGSESSMKKFVATIHAVCEFQLKMMEYDLGPQSAMPIDWKYLKEYSENLISGLAERTE